MLGEYEKVELYLEILEEAKKELRAGMFTVAEVAGDQDDKGSFTLTLEDGRGFKKEIRRPQPKVNVSEALELFKKKNLYHRIDEVWRIKPEQESRVISMLRGTSPELVEKEDVVQESDIEQAFLNGEITDDELRTIVDMGTPTYALKKIKPKEVKA